MNNWIEIKYHLAEGEEAKSYGEGQRIFDSEMPRDDEIVWVTTASGKVELDTYCRRRKTGFFEYSDGLDEEIAWQRLTPPTPFIKRGN